MKGLHKDTHVLCENQIWKTMEELTSDDKILTIDKNFNFSFVSLVWKCFYLSAATQIKGMMSSTIFKDYCFMDVNKNWQNTLSLNNKLLYFTRCNTSHDKFSEETIIHIDNLDNQDLIDIELGVPFFINGGLIVK